MPLQFDAHAALERLHSGFQRYLLEELHLRHPALQAALARAWSASPVPGGWHDALLAEPLYEAAYGFEPGLTLDALQREGVVRSEAARAFRSVFQGRTLFRHQEEALRAVRSGKSIAISAGTGSGKTEGFLLPILDQLYRDHAEGRDDLSQPGIRVLIVYPLNALVNNQMDRLRELIAEAPVSPSLRFAYYTGRLPETRRQGVKAFEDAFGRAPAQGQLVSREEVRATPPHVLITNFSMLEYMLIRPLDAPIFAPGNLAFRSADGTSLPRLRAVVLDEAHVYAGAQAAEIHMLLRRACQRFETRLEDVRGYATSATLQSAGGRDALEEYAAQMFGKTRAQVCAIEGVRCAPPLPPAATTVGGLLAPPDGRERARGLDDLSTLTYDDRGAPIALRLDPKAADTVLSDVVALGLITRARADAIHQAHGEPARVLWTALGESAGVRRLVTHLSESTRRLWTIPELTAFLFELADASPEEAQLDATRLLLRLGSLARRDAGVHPLLPVRVHAFLRAPAGVWVDLTSSTPDADPSWPWQRVTMRPPRQGDADEERRYAEVWACTLCGAPLIGPLNPASLDPDPRGGNLFAPLEPRRAQAATGGGTRLPGTSGGILGALLPYNRTREGDFLHGACPSCLTVEAPVRPVRMSAENAVGVLVDLLYPSLPAMPDDAGRANAALPGEGRRLLLMSDSRQGAAGLASSVESGHDRVLGRQILLRTLKEHASDGATIPLVKVVRALAATRAIRSSAEARALWEQEYDVEREADLLENVAEVLVWRELAVPPHQGRSLETLGLVEVLYPGLDELPLPPGVGHLTVDEWRDFARTVMDDARSRGVGHIPELKKCDVPDGPVADDLPRWANKSLVREGGKGIVEGDEADAAGIGVALISSLNQRRRSRVFRYAQAVARAAQVPAEDGELLLQTLWDQLTGDALRRSLRGWLRYDAEKKALRIDHRGLLARAPDRPAFIDRDNGRAWPRSVRRIVLGVEQRAALIAPEDDAGIFERHAARHAVRRARAADGLDPALFADEHTAQMDADGNSDKERAFRRGHRNLLSTSTTMEMGVDLGGLTGVMLTNAPPAASNYWQRAGRAGRRAEGSALALTLCRNRLHDHRVFDDPRSFLEAPIAAPRVVLDADALLLRHVFAQLLTLFFAGRAVPGAGGGNQTFGTVGSFFFGDPAPDVTFGAWLEEVGEGERAPTNQQLRALVSGTGLDSWTTRELVTECARVIRRIGQEARREEDLLQEQIRSAGADADVVSAIERDRGDLRKKVLIAHLVHGSFLPRFGFPIDLVELRVRLPPNIKDVPSFERDITVALAEYAPGSRIVAGKRVYESAGIEKDWLDRDMNALRRTCYVVCDCGHVQVGIAAPRSCDICGMQFAGMGAVNAAAPLESEADRADRAFATPSNRRDAAVGPPRPRSFFRPASFATRTERPQLLRYAPKRKSVLPGRATVELLSAAATSFDASLDGALLSAFTAESPLLVRSEGRSDDPEQPGGFGFAICKACGRAAPEVKWAGNAGTPVPGALGRHRPLRFSGNQSCQGPFWRNAVLGVIRSVDALRLRLDGPLALPTSPGARQQSAAVAFTLAALLVPAVAEVLQIDARVLTPAVCRYRQPDGSVCFEAAVYEDSASGQLARVAPMAADLLRRVVALAESGSWVDLVRFDNQFSLAEGELDLAAFRAHFEASTRSGLPAAPTLADTEEVRGRTPRERLAAILAEPRGRFQPLVVASGIGSDAESLRGDPLRLLRASALERDGARVLLLNGLPDRLEGRMGGARLLRLIEDGVEVRVAAPGALVGRPWRMLGKFLGERAVFGAIAPSGTSTEPIVPAQDELGPGWLEGHRLLRPIAARNDEAAAEMEAAWARAEVIAVDALRDRVGARLARISPRSPIAPGSILGHFLAPLLGVASLAALGPIASVVYEDVYVARRPRTLAAFERLLAELNLAADAVVRVRHGSGTTGEHPDPGSLWTVPACETELSSADARKLEHRMFLRWEKRIDLAFAHVRQDGELDGGPVPGDAAAVVRGRIHHFRRLWMRTVGGREIEVFLDKGLDWARPVRGDDADLVNGTWTTTAETFALVARDGDATRA